MKIKWMEIGGSILLLASAAVAETRPNVVWIVVEDMSCHFGYQGEPLVRTPHVDRLAREGILCKNAIATAPGAKYHPFLRWLTIAFGPAANGGL